MCEGIETAKLRSEIVAYRFPEGGGEYIKNQIHRHQHMFPKDTVETTKDYYLEENEQVFSHDNFQAILGKDDSGSSIYLAKYSHNSILSNEELIEICDSEVPTSVTIIYHSDLDGHASAALVSRIFKQFDSEDHKNLIFFRYSYSNSSLEPLIKRVEFGNTTISMKHVAIIVDLNLNPEDLTKLLQIFNRVIFIDHHKVSIDNFMSLDMPMSSKVTCLVDTRYSAVYLCYLLFADIIKERLGLKYGEEFPAMISAMDNAQAKTSASRYVSVKVTQANIGTLKNSKYIVRKGQKTEYTLSDSPKMIGKYIMIRNPMTSDKDIYPNLAKCGSYLNHYFLESGDFVPYMTELWDDMFTNHQSLTKSILIGQELRELDFQKITALGLKDSVYTAAYMNKCIRGLMAKNFEQFLTINGIKHTQVLIRYESNTLLGAWVRSYEEVLRTIRIGDILEDFFQTKKSKQYGHINIGCVHVSIRKARHIYDDLKSRSLPIAVTRKYHNIYNIFDHMEIHAPKPSPRATPPIKILFTLISTVIFTVWQMSIQEQVQNG